MNRDIKRSLAAALVAFSIAAPAMAQDGEIVIGNTMPYSGPLSAFGVVGRSVTAYFDRVNDEGGVSGRKVRVISGDDSANPAKTLELTRGLVERDRVLAMFSIIGAAPNLAIREYMNARKVPQLIVSSGATVFSATPENYPWTMGWTPSAETEGVIVGRDILVNHAGARVAVLYQNDDFGKDYLAGLRRALGDKADEVIVSVQSYETADPTVDSQIITLANSGATVFVNISTPKFGAQAIRKVAELRWQPAHYIAFAASSIGTVLEPAGIQNSEGIVTVKFIKDPTDPKWADDEGFKSWKNFMTRYLPNESQADSNAVIGYSQAETMHHILTLAGENPTRQSVMDAARSIDGLQLSMLLPGITLSTSATNYAPIRCLKLARFSQGAWEVRDDLICADE